MAVTPLDSASVVLVRPTTAPAARADYEVFMVRRAQASDFAPDVFVFPGGILNPADAPPPDAPPLGLSAEWAHTRLEGPAKAGGATSMDSLALWLTGVRELFEEAGVLLARGAAGELVAVEDAALAARLAADRLALQRDETTLWAVCGREGLVPAPERLLYWGHFITPEAAPRRFNTRFFLAVMPPGQEALHCDVETTAGLWIAPEVALQRFAAGDFPLVYATRSHLERLTDFPALDALLAHCATKPVVTVRPVADFSVKPTRVSLPEGVAGCW